MVKLTIDGRQTEAKEGMMVLDVARSMNIYIPTLCTHEALSPYGACRLCMVEIATKSGRSRMVTSCLYPVEEGLTVQTNTQKVAAHRKILIELLMARCPNNAVLMDLGRRLGATPAFFPEENPGKNNNCILCGLCTRTCAEVVGQSAISFVSRGIGREMAVPFFDHWDACIACGSCSYVCPTGAIILEDKDGVRSIKMPHNEKQFELAQCEQCGSYWIPKRQIAWMAQKSGLPVEAFDKCMDCRD